MLKLSCTLEEEEYIFHIWEPSSRKWTDGSSN